MSENQQELVEQSNNPPAATNDPTTIMQVISKAAADPETDVDKLERLMGMYERLESRRAEAAFYDALAAVQDELPEITERGEIKHSGKLISTYALWEDINRAIKPVLKQYGLALSFHTETSGQVCVEGILSHRQGHKESTSITLPSDTSGAKNPVQSVASSISYGKRYVAGALLNLTSRGEDDDAQAAGGPALIDDEQAANIHALLDETGSDRQKFLDYLKVSSVEAIPAQAYDHAVNALETKRRRSS